MLLPNAKSVSNRSISAGAMNSGSVKSMFVAEVWSFSPSVALCRLLVGVHLKWVSRAGYLFIGALGIRLAYWVGLESAVVDNGVAHFSSLTRRDCQVAVCFYIAVKDLHCLYLFTLRRSQYFLIPCLAKAAVLTQVSAIGQACRMSLRNKRPSTICSLRFSTCKLVSPRLGK